MKKAIYKTILKAAAIMPLGFLYLVSDFIAFVLKYVVGYRKKVIRNNLSSSFPMKTLPEIKKIERGFYRYLGDQMVETIKLLHISDKELKKRVRVEHYELVNASLREDKPVVIMLGHYGNWEWVQEISRYFVPESYKASIYHPLNHHVWDELFIELRSRWGARILPMKQAPRQLLKRENRPWVCGFIADQWTNKKTDDNYLEFLNHKTWFIYGPEEIGRKVGADFFYLEVKRERRGHYVLRFKKLEPRDFKETYPYSRQFWKEFEKTIEEAPAYWLWSHKRWK